MKDTNNCLKKLKDLNTWRDIPCLWIERLHVVKMLILAKLSCKWCVSTCRYSAVFESAVKIRDTVRLILCYRNINQ